MSKHLVAMRVHAFGSLVALLAVACGGGAQTEPQTPASPAPQAAPNEATSAAPAATTSNVEQAAPASVQPVEAPSTPKGPVMNAAGTQAYQAGVQAFQAGDLQGAKAQFSRASEADPNAYQADYSEGVVQERLGSKSAALSAYRAAYGVVKGYEPAISAYALLLAKTGDTSEAEDFLNRERAMLPDSATVLAALAEVKSIEKDSADAQQLAQEALKKNPDCRPAMVTLARDHYRNRRLDLALYTLTAILDGYGPENPPRDKDNAEALLLRALIYKEQGRRRDAFADFKRAVELRPDLIEAKVDLATYMLEAGNATDAVPLLENALGYDASNTLIHLDLGDAYRLEGRPADALKHLEWVVNKDPTVAEVHYNLGLLYLFSSGIPNTTPAQAVDKAIAELETFKSMRPRTKAGAGDDVDELLSRAKNKKAILQAEASAPPPAPAATPPPAAAPTQAPAGAPTSAAAPPPLTGNSGTSAPPATAPAAAPSAPAPAAASGPGSKASFPSK